MKFVNVFKKIVVEIGGHEILEGCATICTTIPVPDWLRHEAVG